MKYTLKTSEINQTLSNPKPLSSNNNTNTNTAVHHSPTYSDTSNLCNEPTSVLDIRSSPIPPSSTAVIPPPLSDVLSEDLPLQWDESSDDWDQLLTGLGVTVPFDTAPTGSRLSTFPQLGLGIYDPQLLPSPLPEFSPTTTQFVDCSTTPFVLSDLITLSDQNDLNLNALDVSNNNSSVAHWIVGSDSVDELIRAAGCVDSNELQLALGILARLNPRLQSHQGKPLQRAAFYFKEGLTSLLLTGSNRRPRSSSSSEIVQTIRAYKAFSGISPIPMFSHFTANQVLLEALDGSAFIHVIDFDIGLGGKWASFMRDVADRSEICRLNPPVLRISAVVPEEFAAESRLIGDSLIQFARELRLGFHIEFVLTRSFDVLSFNAIKFIDGEKTAVHLSPATFARLGATNDVTGFLSDLRRLSPRVVVFVDGDGWIDAGTPSFRQNFINGLEFFSTMLESLDATGGGGGNDWVRRIEMFLVRPKIFAAVKAAAGGRRVAPWKELLVGAGLRAVQLSQFTDIQAEYLLGKSQVKGFHVAKRHGEMMLCWHERPLVATSAWRCC